VSKDTSKSRRAPSAAPSRDPGPPAGTDGRPAGQVRFDDRGNAIWEWALKTGEFVKDTASERLKKLENPNLSLADDAPPASRAAANPTGTVTGYNPYNSGKLDAKDARKKKDLRKLGEWLALKRQAERNKLEDE
jgi:hypothetical protein